MVHTDDTHHTEALHGDERRVVDARDALDGLGVVAQALTDNGSGSIGIERILN